MRELSEGLPRFRGGIVWFLSREVLTGTLATRNPDRDTPDGVSKSVPRSSFAHLGT